MNAGAPNITGMVERGYSTIGIYTSGKGALSVSNVGSTYLQPGVSSQNDVYKTFSIDASRSSSIYGSSATINPISLTTFLLIKY